MSFYELQAPTSWADPPAMWSSTSFDEIETCPRRWQLLRSGWGSLDRFPVRPHPAAVEGQIVHNALDRLTRACGRRGNPLFGSAEFEAALSDAAFFPGFARAVTEVQLQFATHPRPGPVFRLRASAEELANRAVRMFREQYKPAGLVTLKAAERVTDTPADVNGLLRQKQALSEVKLTHPFLPFLGILDRVQHTGEGVEIVDFKTGKRSARHQHQLLRYALLWWRKTGDMPIRVSAQYFDGILSWPVTSEALESVEADLTMKLRLLTDTLAEHPAVAKPGPDCRSCQVRARCSAGWSIGEDAALSDGRGDVEVVVKANAGGHGYIACARNGAEIAIVFDSSVAKLLSDYVDGQVLRILNGVWKERRTQLEIKAWTEVFVVIEEP